MEMDADEELSFDDFLKIYFETFPNEHQFLLRSQLGNSSLWRMPRLVKFSQQWRRLPSKKQRLVKINIKLSVDLVVTT